MKTENIPIKFIDSTVYFIIDEMKRNIEQQYLKEIAAEKQFMRNYDDTIKSVKSDNNKVDNIVQEVNNESVKLQEEVQAAKQLRMQLCNYLITELMKPKTHYKRLLDMEDNVKMYVYGFRDISTKCRTRYLLAVSPDNKLTTSTPLLLYPADRELKDFIVGRGGIEFTHENEWYKLDEANKICGRDTGLWCFIIAKHGTAYKKTKNLQPLIDIVDVFDYYREEDKGDDEVYKNSNTNVEANIKWWKEYKDEFFKHKYINSNKLHKIDEIVKEGDVVEVLDCYGWKGTNLLKCRINDNILECKSNKWMDEIITDRESVFKVVVGIEKRHPVAKRKLVSFVL